MAIDDNITVNNSHPQVVKMADRKQMDVNLPTEIRVKPKTIPENTQTVYQKKSSTSAVAYQPKIVSQQPVVIADAVLDLSRNTVQQAPVQRPLPQIATILQPAIVVGKIVDHNPPIFLNPDQYRVLPRAISIPRPSSSNSSVANSSPLHVKMYRHPVSTRVTPPPGINVSIVDAKLIPVAAAPVVGVPFVKPLGKRLLPARTSNATSMINLKSHGGRILTFPANLAAGKSCLDGIPVVHGDNGVVVRAGPMVKKKKLMIDNSIAPCKVCGDVSSGIHYGVKTCEGCKSFFLRELFEFNLRLRSCIFNFSCVMTPRQRNHCLRCRMDKCLNVGMSRCLTVMGRRRKKKLNIVEKSDSNIEEACIGLLSLNSANDKETMIMEDGGIVVTEPKKIMTVEEKDAETERLLIAARGTTPLRKKKKKQPAAKLRK